MIDLALRLAQRFGLLVGLILIGISLLLGGLKFYEHATHTLTDATVTALMTKCDMNYRTGRFSSTHVLAACGDVPAVKARYPEVSWTVSRVPYVEVAYATPSGQAMRTTAALGKLERETTEIGDKIPVLVWPKHPDHITGPANANFFYHLGLMFVGGIGLFGGSRWIKKLRQREQQPPAIAHVLPIAPEDIKVPAPVVATPAAQWPAKPPTVVPAIRAQFGRR